MKYASKNKWVWNPKGFMLAIVVVVLLVGASFIHNGIATTIMIVLAILITIIGYGRTLRHIKQR